MRMKKTFIITLAIVLNLGGAAYASEGASFKGEAGIAPGNILYKLDRAIENVRLNLTKKEEKKALLLEQYSIERIGESEKVIEDKGYDKAEELLEEANINLKDAVETADNDLVVDNEGAEVDNSSSDEIKNEEVIDTINDSMKNSLEVLESIKEKLPEESKEKIQGIIEFQKAKQEYITSKKVLLKDFQACKKQVQQLEQTIKKAQKSGEDTLAYEAQLKTTIETLVEKKSELKELKAVMPKMNDFKSQDKETNEVENKNEENTVDNGETAQNNTTELEDTKKEQATNNYSNVEQKVENIKQSQASQKEKTQTNQEKNKQNKNGEKSNK